MNVRRLIMTLALALCLSLTASAEEWLLLWKEGEKPHRSVFYMATDFRNMLSAEEEIATVLNSRTQQEMDRAGELAKTVRVQVMQVYESADGPYASSYWADFRARDQACRLEKGIHWYRDDRVSEEFDAPQWQSVPNNWQRRAFDMAMQDKPWREALARLREQERAGRRVSQDELIGLGTFSVRRHVLPTQLADLTWQTFWEDGKRPPLGIHQALRRASRAGPPGNPGVSRVGSRRVDENGGRRLTPASTVGGREARGRATR